MTGWTTAPAAIAAKDLRHLARDRGAFFFTFVFPIGMAIFFGTVFGGGDGQSQDIELAVYDADGGAGSRGFVAELTAPGQGLVARPAASPEACEAQVRGREAMACLMIPPGFGGGLEGMLAGQPARVEVVVDPSRRAEAGLLTGQLIAGGFRQLSNSMQDPTAMAAVLAGARTQLAGQPGVPAATRAALEQLYGGLDALSVAGAQRPAPAKQETKAASASAGGGWQPLEVKTRELAARRGGPPSSFAVSFPQGVVWGLMSCVMTFVGAVIRERSRGTMVRLTAAPISPAQVLLGKSLACFVTCLSVQVLILALGRLAFGVEVGSPAWMAVAVLCASAGFTGLTVLMAGLSRSEQGADGLGRAALMVLALIGGGAIPLAFMPAGLAAVSDISPFKWAALAFEGALWRGFDAPQMALPCGILLALAGLGFVGGTALLRRLRVA